MSGAMGGPGGGAPPAGCAICGQVEGDPRRIALCYGCRRPFHLNPYAAPGVDCGDVWAGSAPDDGFTGLELYCAPCFQERCREADAALSASAAAVETVRRGGGPPPRPERPPWPRRYRRRQGGAL